MKTSAMQKSTDSETAIKTLKECATKIRKRRVPLSLPQQTSLLRSVIRILRKVMKEGRRDVTKWAGRELKSLSDTMAEEP